MKRKQIKLNEENLRNFISYSVAKILNEAYGMGKYDSGVFKLEFDPENDDNMEEAYQSVLQEPDFQGINEDELVNVWPVNVKVWYTIEREEGGDRGETYESASVEHWEPDTSNVPDDLYNFVNAVLSNFFEGGYFTENDIFDQREMHGGMFEEGNTGILTHFGSKESEEAAERYPNPYENMTWDEYCEAKKKEREDDEEKKKLHDLNYPNEKKDRMRNRGIMTHVPGKKDNSIKITQQDLAEMIEKAVCQLKESLSLPGYDAWKTRTPYDDEPSIISKDDFFENIAQDGDPGYRYNQCKEFLEWLADYDQEVYEKVMHESQATGENVFVLAMNNGIDWKEIARDFYDLTPVNYYKDDMYESAGKRKPVNEISKGLLDRAREAAHKDMMRNFGDTKIRNKRERQWDKFNDEYRKMDREEKDSICPQVDERDLANMPEDTYVVLNGDGRDAVNANFRASYSGRAGTKEQCEEYVKRFYDMGANWEYLPEIVPIEDYLNSRR